MTGPATLTCWILSRLRKHDDLDNLKPAKSGEEASSSLLRPALIGERE